MYKSIALFRRKAGLTHEAFKAYYEDRHVPLKASLLTLPGLERYVRRYLEPISDPITGDLRQSGFDVITELWFRDKASFDHYRAVSLDPEYRRLTAEDEDRFLDREHMYFHTVDERDLALS